MILSPARVGLAQWREIYRGADCTLDPSACSENKTHAHPASVDSIPTSANQEDHVSMAAHGARRLQALTENLRAIIAIELLAAAEGCDFHRLPSSTILEAVRASVPKIIPHLEDDRYFAPDIEAAIALVRSNTLPLQNLPGVA